MSFAGGIFSGQMPGWDSSKGFYNAEHAQSCLRQISDDSPLSNTAKIVSLLIDPSVSALGGLSLFAERSPAVALQNEADAEELSASARRYS